jgi:uncharacterized membrane protein YgcG
MSLHAARCWLAAGLMLVAGAELFGQEKTKEQPKKPEPAVGEQPLPLKRVVLFSSSVGFFEHGGSVEGNQQIEFTFKTEDINDLLKSMVVQDRGGGFITSVNYGSPDPLTRTLRTFTIDLTDSPTLAEIFHQLRGHEVKLETPTAITGTIVGVEQRQVASGGDKLVPVEVVNVRTNEGLRSVRLDTISRTQFTSAKIDKEFQTALDLIAGQHASDQKRVKLDFRGAGKRQVDVGYIQEAPVWKTTYRLVLNDKEAPFLQGWAIVENTSTQDWSDVQLSLVSGRPISFLMDLAQPLYMTRPFVVPELHASLSPKVYDQDLASREQEFRGAAGGAAGGMGGGGFGGGGGSFGGGGSGMFGGGGTGRPRPLVTSVVPVVDGDPEEKNTLDLAQGVQSAAAGGDVGELFRYSIKTPVTLPRNESAMLPIVNAAVKGEKLAIYNPAVHAKHPLAGLKLTNTTDLHLLQGPVTIFDDGEYAGDARIEDISPGSTRLISYALDLETEIAVEVKPEERVITKLQISKGGLHVQQKFTRETIYTVKNSSQEAKQLLLERPISPEWKAVKPEPDEKTRSLQRFRVTAAPGKPAAVVILDERETTGEIVLANLLADEMTIYTKLPIAKPQLIKAFEQVLQARTKVTTVAESIAAQDLQANMLAQDQERIRRNLQALPSIRTNELVSEENKKATNELLNRYIKRLGELDAEIEKARSTRLTLDQEHQRAKQALEKLLAELVVE